MPRHNAQRAHRTITGALFFFHATRKRGTDERFSSGIQAIARSPPLTFLFSEKQPQHQLLNPLCGALCFIINRAETVFHKQTAVSLTNNHRFLMQKTNLYKMLSDCNRISFFSSEFSDIPRKISAYLRTESSSGANTRIMRGFYIVLIINDLYL